VDCDRDVLRQLAGIVKKAAQAARARGKKPATISAGCQQTIDQQIGDVRQRLTDLRQ